MAVIAGHVRDTTTNTGVAGARVVAYFKGGVTQRFINVGDVTTDANGFYTVVIGKPGTYRISISHQNYAGGKTAENFTDGTKDVVMDFTLTPRNPRRTPTPLTPPTPTVPPPGRRGTIYGKVTDKRTEKIIDGVTIAINAPNVPPTYSDDGGEYETYDLPEGRRYTVVAAIEGYKRSIKTSPEVRGRTELNFELESEKPPAGIKGGMPIFTSKWWWDNKVRFGVAAFFTGFVYLFFYKPIILDGLGLFDPFLVFFPLWLFLNIFVPFGFFLTLFFVLPKPDDMKKIDKWGPFVLAIIIFFVVLGASFSPPFRFLGASPTIRVGLPFILALIAAYMAKADEQNNKGLWPSLLRITSIMFLLGVILFGANLVTSGALLNIETYLRPLDVLNVIGVPQETIDDMKDGVRSVLSFLQFKGAEPTTPEAKKIGGFEAIQLNFGSKYNTFLLPTLLARMNYTLPVTVTNPNKFDTSLVVKDFTISDIFLDNRSSERIMCGSTSEGQGKILLGNIQPEEEKITTVDFENKSYCIKVLEYKPSKPTNPMFPAKVKVDLDKTKKETECKDNTLPNGSLVSSGDTDTACVKLLQNFYNRYFAGGQIPVATSKDVSARYIDGEDVCECKLNRYYNIMDELCFLDNDKARVELKSTYGFSVQGKGEVILVKSDADRKLAPKPTITSSAGPLTVTTYFVSDVHVPDKTKTSIMFIHIKNEGDGNALIKQLKINSVIFIGTSASSQKTQTLEDIVTINQCQPSSVDISVSKDGITLTCPVSVTANSVAYKNKVSGDYLTIPVIVDVDYTYSQTHSTTINVKKEIIPEGVTDQDQINDLKRQFEPLPYYCPSELKVYSASD